MNDFFVENFLQNFFCYIYSNGLFLLLVASIRDTSTTNMLF